MIRRKKHSNAEIAAKLAQADDLAKGGMLQREVARTLDVSVMTLHRWRRIRLENATPSGPEEIARFEEELGSGRRIAELELENSRLRRLITDLLLERVKLAETAQGNNYQPRGKTRSK
jgi:putative transposase